MMTGQAQNVDATDLSGKLAAVVGDEHVLTDQETLELHSLDFSDQQWATAAIVVRPGSTEEVAETVAMCLESRHGVCRSGGLESHREKNHIAFGMIAGQLESIERGINDANVTALCFD